MKAFGIGLFRTGTNSIYEMFRRSFRSGHEFMKGSTLLAIQRRMSGSISEEDFSSFIRLRDSEGNLEMDSAGFHCFYIDVLAREFPAAKTILTIRDCYSWVNSCMGVILQRDAKDDVPFFASFVNGLELSPDRRLHWGERAGYKVSIEQLMRMWTLTNAHMLETVPPDRLLVVKLEDLSRSLPRIAEFVGAPVEALDFSHSNKTVGLENYMSAFDTAELTHLFDRQCSELMSRMYPGFTFSQFARDASLAQVSDPEALRHVFAIGWQRADR